MLPEQNGAYDLDLAAPAGNRRGVTLSNPETPGNPQTGENPLRFPLSNQIVFSGAVVQAAVARATPFLDRSF